MLNNSLNNENVYKTTPTITNTNADSSTTYTANKDCLMTYNLYSYGGAARLVINGITRSIASNGSKTAPASNINSIVLHKGDIVTFTTVGTQETDYLIQFSIYEK